MSSCLFLKAQEVIEVELIESKALIADAFIGVNMFEEIFYIKNDVLFKKKGEKLYSYQNRLLGTLNFVDLLNSLEMILFYKDFNTAVKLDWELGEISKVDFNKSNVFSTVAYAASASNKRLWIFNSDIQQLQVYNPQQDIVEVSTQSVASEVVGFYSNYNFCWVLTKKELLQYNIYGNLLNGYDIEEFEAFVHYKDSFVLKKGSHLYSLSIASESPKLITLPELTIKDFSVINETLYIYDGKELYSFKINSNKEKK